MFLSEIENYVGISHKKSLFYNILQNWKFEIQQGKNYTVDGRFGSFEVRSMQANQYGFQLTWDFMIFDLKKNKYAAGIDLSSFGRNKRSWQVERIGVADDYQGMNLSVQFYEWIIKQKNLILMTGFMQTAGGKFIWERLAEVPGIFIFGYDVKKKESFQIDQKDLFNEDVYIDEMKREYTELQNEYIELETYADRFHVSKDTTFKDNPEAKKRMTKLSQQISSLRLAMNHTGDYIRLVAIKSQK